MRRTKIVATIGPASRDRGVLLELIRAGMDVARLNFSHGSHEQHAETAEWIRDAAGRAGRPVAILQDLPGPKLRIGKLEHDLAELKPGDLVTFSCGVDGDQLGNARNMTISWAGLPEAIEAGEVLYLADGSVRLRATAIRAGEGEIDAEVEVGGAVASRQGVNVPGETAALPAVPEEDIVHLQAGVRMGVDMVAVSFVRRPEDITGLREHTRAPLIAKFEKPQAVERAEEIIRVSDCIMVARGDLGIELPIEQVPVVQKQLLAQAGAHARPAITATQMLDSMVTSSRPTRAEASDVANAILDGTSAVMLSGETAIGDYPVEAVQVMERIALAVEPSLGYRHELPQAEEEPTIGQAMSNAACDIAEALAAKAILVPTFTGRTASAVARLRPRRPIIAITHHGDSIRHMALEWGVTPIEIPETDDVEDLWRRSVEAARRSGLVEPGDRVVITAGTAVNIPGSTNVIKVDVA